MTARERSELAQGSGAATIHGKRTADVPDTRGQRRAGDHAVELVLRQPGHEIAGGVWAVRDTVAARRVEHVEPCGRQPFTGVRAWRVEGIRLTQVVGLGGGELHRGVRRRSSLTGKRKTAMANIPSPGQRVSTRRGAPRGGSSVSRLGLFDDGSALPLSDALAAQLRVEPHRVPCQALEVFEVQAHAFRIPVVDMVRLKFILAEQDDTLVPLMLR